MASGQSRRFEGGNKLLADFHGRPLAEYVLQTARKIPFTSKIVVTRTPEIQTLCRALRFPCLLHDFPGLNDTIRLGLQALLTAPLDGCLFLQSDQPFLSADSINTLLLAFFADPHFIYRLACGSAVGSPVLFPASLFPALQALPDDCGGNVVLRNHAGLVRTVQAHGPYELLDADTQEELEQLRMLTV